MIKKTTEKQFKKTYKEYNPAQDIYCGFIDIINAIWIFKQKNVIYMRVSEYYNKSVYNDIMPPKDTFYIIK